MKRVIAIILYIGGLAFAQDSVMSYPPTWKLNPDGSIGPVADRNVTIGATVFLAPPTGADDTARIQAAINDLLGGGTVYLPAAIGAYAPWHITSSITLRSGVSIVGDMPQTTYTPGVPADFSITPAGGTWIDCGGYTKTCFVGSGLRGTNLYNFGIVNFLKGFVLGSDGVDGIGNSTARNVFASGGPAANDSEVTWEITNMEHFNTYNLMNYRVNIGAHLVNQCSIQGFNSSWDDFYVYALAKTIANGNSTKPEIWIENKQPTIGIAASLSTFTMNRLQTNSYGGDKLNNHITVSGLSDSAPAIVHLLNLDIEGEAAAGLACSYCQNGVFSFLGVSTPPIQVATFSLDSHSTFNTAISNHNVSVASGTGSTTAAQHNLFLGHWGNTALRGVYDDTTSGTFRAILDTGQFSTKVTVGDGTISGIVIKPAVTSGVFTPRNGDDSADAPIAAPTAVIGAGAVSADAFDVTRNDGTTKLFQVDNQNSLIRTQGPVILNKKTGSFPGSLQFSDSNNEIYYDTNNVAHLHAYSGQWVLKNMSATLQCVLNVGTGSPNGSVTGSPCDLYLNAAGGAATSFYVKESGAATNTGWVGK